MDGKTASDSPPDALRELLARLGDEEPDQPWIFHPAGLDWRWLSRGEAWRRLDRLIQALPDRLAAEGGGEAGVAAFPCWTRPSSGVGSPDGTDPEHVEPESDGSGAPAFLPVSALLIDLALQASGWGSVPVPQDGAGSRPARGSHQEGHGVTHWIAPSPSSATTGHEGDRRAGRPEGPRQPSGWLDDRQLDPSTWRIERPGSGGHHVDANSPQQMETGTAQAMPEAAPPRAASGTPALTQDLDLLAALTAAERWQLSRAPTKAPTPTHEVTIAGRGAGDPGERFLVASSLLTGAALVLEPNPAARATTAAWARASLFLGDGDDLDRLHHQAEAWDDEWRRGPVRRAWRWLLGRLGVRLAPSPPFGRLHTVVLADAPGASFPAAEYWHGRGVRTVDLASLVQ